MLLFQYYWDVCPVVTNKEIDYIIIRAVSRFHELSASSPTKGSPPPLMLIRRNKIEINYTVGFDY